MEFCTRIEVQKADQFHKTPRLIQDLECLENHDLVLTYLTENCLSSSQVCNENENMPFFSFRLSKMRSGPSKGVRTQCFD